MAEAGLAVGVGVAAVAATVAAVEEASTSPWKRTVGQVAAASEVSDWEAAAREVVTGGGVAVVGSAGAG